jgi:hypothetical protein
VNFEGFWGKMYIDFLVRFRAEFGHFLLGTYLNFLRNLSKYSANFTVKNSTNSTNPENAKILSIIYDLIHLNPIKIKKIMDGKIYMLTFTLDLI